MDTIDLTAVDEQDRLDQDEADPLSGSSAIEGGDDAKLTDVFHDPGEVVAEVLG